MAAIPTLADLLEELGGISPSRVRMRPPPGTATEQDVLADRRQTEKPLLRACRRRFGGESHGVVGIGFGHRHRVGLAGFCGSAKARRCCRRRWHGAAVSQIAPPDPHAGCRIRFARERLAPLGGATSALFRSWPPIWPLKSLARETLPLRCNTQAPRILRRRRAPGLDR